MDCESIKDACFYNKNHKITENLICNFTTNFLTTFVIFLVFVIRALHYYKLLLGKKPVNCTFCLHVLLAFV